MNRASNTNNNNNNRNRKYQTFAWIAKQTNKQANTHKLPNAKRGNQLTMHAGKFE